MFKPKIRSIPLNEDHNWTRRSLTLPDTKNINNPEEIYHQTQDCCKNSSDEDIQANCYCCNQKIKPTLIQHPATCVCSNNCQILSTNKYVKCSLKVEDKAILEPVHNNCKIINENRSKLKKILTSVTLGTDKNNSESAQCEVHKPSVAKKQHEGDDCCMKNSMDPSISSSHAENYSSPYRISNSVQNFQKQYLATNKLNHDTSCRHENDEVFSGDFKDEKLLYATSSDNSHPDSSYHSTEDGKCKEEDVHFFHTSVPQKQLFDQKNQKQISKETKQKEETDFPISNRLIANYLQIHEEFDKGDTKTTKNEQYKRHYEPESRKKNQNSSFPDGASRQIEDEKIFHKSYKRLLNNYKNSIYKNGQIDSDVALILSPPRTARHQAAPDKQSKDKKIKTYKKSRNKSPSTKKTKSTSKKQKKTKSAAKNPKRNKETKHDNDFFPEKQANIKLHKVEVTEPKIRLKPWKNDQSSNLSTESTQSNAKNKTDKAKSTTRSKNDKPPWNANVKTNCNTFNSKYQHFNKPKDILEKTQSIFERGKIKQNKFKRLYQKSQMDEDSEDINEEKTDGEIHEIYNYADHQTNDIEVDKYLSEVTLKDVDIVRNKVNRLNFEEEIKKIEGWKKTVQVMEELLDKNISSDEKIYQSDIKSSKNSLVKSDDKPKSPSSSIKSPKTQVFNVNVENPKQRMSTDLTQKLVKPQTPPRNVPNFHRPYSNVIKDRITKKYMNSKQPLQDIPEHTCVNKFDESSLNEKYCSIPSKSEKSAYSDANKMNIIVKEKPVTEIRFRGANMQAPKVDTARKKILEDPRKSSQRSSSKTQCYTSSHALRFQKGVI